MADNKGILSEIVIRKIPQIIGVYIASVWLAVEISDWMSGRFELLQQFSTYVFIGMLAFLPTVILVAWGHGRPGKDQWSKLEFYWIPINLMLSVAAINFFVDQPQAEIRAISQVPIPPIVSKIVKGSESPILKGQKVEVNKNNHHRVISFFWENKTSDISFDWLSYGASWLFTQDMKRTPNISATSPYNSAEIISELKNRGYERSLNIPLSLAIQVASKNAKKWMVMGAFFLTENNIEFEAKLYRVSSGELVKVLNASDGNILNAIDQISNKMSQFLLAANNDETNIIPDLTIEDHTSSNIEAIRHLISAKNHISFDNNYDKAIEETLKALALDQSFAEAHVLAVDYYQGIGDFPSAIKHSKLALALDHKIYKETVYAVKARLFGLTGQKAKSLLVVENWAQVFPGSVMAHATLANKYLFSNNYLDKAEEQFEKLLSIDSNNPKTLINLSKIYRVQEKKDKSIEVLKEYLSKNPDKVDAYLELAAAYKQFSLFDQAIEMYQQASILDGNNYEAEIAIANITAMKGDYILAVEQLQTLLLQKNTDQQQFDLLGAQIPILIATGQINQASITLESMNDLGKKVLAPSEYIFTIDSTRVEFLILKGKYQEALDYIERLKANSKPPFDKVASSFSLHIYSVLEDVETFKKEFDAFDAFLKSFPIQYFEPIMLSWKARMLYWQGELENSVFQLDMAIEETKQSIIGLFTFEMTDELMYYKAEILFELGQAEKALDVLGVILHRNPLFGKAHYLMVKIYQQQNKLDMAKISMQKAMKIWQYADEDFVDLVELEKLYLD